MELRGKQQRLLKLLAEVDNLGGRVVLSLKHGDKDDYYQVSGWKQTQTAEPLDVDFTIGKDYVDELVENRCIQLSDGGEGDVSITPVGLDLVQK